MKLRKTVAAGSITALLLGAGTMFAPTVASGQSTVRPAPAQPTIGPISQDYDRTLDRLEQAERADEMNSTNWEESDPAHDHYYGRKADQANTPINRLGRGTTYPVPEINDALKDKPRY